MASYSVHWRDEGECSHCDEPTRFLIHSNRLVDAGDGRPMTVAEWICEGCLELWDDDDESFLPDWMVREAEWKSNSPFGELRPDALQE